MSLLVENLSRACAEHLLAEKWLVAPSLRAGHQWLDRVTRGGGPLVNTRVKTTRSLALEVLAPSLAEGRMKLASAAARRLVVAESWDAAMQDDGYLGRTRRSPRLLALAERALLDLRLAGVKPRDIDPGHFEHQLKGRELKALLAAYESALAERGLIDHADAMRLAAAQLGKVQPDRDAVLLVPDDLRLAPLEERLLDALGATRVTLAVDEPRRAAETTEITHAVGEVNEVRAVLRACLHEAVALDDVEVACTAAEPYVPLIYETAQRVFGTEAGGELGIPVTFAEGLPARLSRPGRLLIAWLSWVREDFPQSTLLRMLQARLLVSPVDDAGEPVSATRLVRALRGAGIGFERSRYLPCLRRRVEALERRVAAEDASHLERGLADARALLGLVAPLIESTPAGGSNDLVAAAAALLRDHARVSSALDGLARQRLLQEIDSMRDALDAAGTLFVPGFDAWEWLAELPDTLRVGGSGPRPGQLHVSSVRAGGHAGRGHTFIIGLDDGRFPAAGRQDPLLLDAERGRLSGALPTARTRLREQVEDFQRLLGRLRGPVTLSYPARNVVDDSETFAGSVVLSAFREVHGDDEADHSAMREALGAPASFAPQDDESCLDAGEWWQCRGADAVAGNLGELAGVSFPNLRRGREAAQARVSTSFTVFDGRIERPSPALDPGRPEGPVLSATSSLGNLGRCPLAYFQKHVLKIEPPAEVAMDPGTWLDHLEFGTLLHDVLYEFVGMLIAERAWPPRPDRDHARIAAVVERLAAAMRRDVPPPTEQAFERQVGELARAAAIFVEEQARETEVEPVFLEATIGLPSEARNTDLDAPDPVELDVGEGVTVRARGRVDRIDRLRDDPDAFIIWDYKSGRSARRWDPSDVFNEGRLLQHALYVAITESVLKRRFGDRARVTAFRFFFPSISTLGRVVWFTREMLAPGPDLIRRLCRLAGRGAFPATNCKDDCRFCDYKAACRAANDSLDELCAASGRKLANPDNDVLAPFVELRLDRS